MVQEVEVFRTVANAKLRWHTLSELSIVRLSNDDFAQVRTIKTRAEALKKSDLPKKLFERLFSNEGI